MSADDSAGRTSGSVAARVLRALGGLGALAGCTSMTAMLPGVLASAFSAVGLASSSAAGRALAPVAVPLFVVSAVLLIVGALACSRLATICALGGCALAYVGMFVLADGASMSGMAAMAPSSTVSKAVFSVGAALIVASFVITPLRRRHGTCAPVLAALRR